jgi:hypothetical protein
MLFLPGPVKVDLIFERPYEQHGPWAPSRENLPLIEHHFWDWTLWLGSKQLRGEKERVEEELEKMSRLLLRPLGAEDVPRSLGDAIDAYRRARSNAEQRFAIQLEHRMETEVVHAFEETGLLG